MSTLDTNYTYYPNGIAVDAEAGINFVNGDGDITPALVVLSGVAAVTGSEVVVTGLSDITAATVSLSEDATIGGLLATCTFTGGSLTIKVWKPTAVDDATPIASSAEVDVCWIATGTA